MLNERYGSSRLEELGFGDGPYAPFPKAEDREDWGSISSETRERWLRHADRYADYGWPVLKVSDYRAYWTSGDLSRLSLAYFERRSVLGILVIAECMEGEGKYLDQILNGIFAICEETTWVFPGHRSHWKEFDTQESIPSSTEYGVELSSVETARLLLWTRYLLGSKFDAISPRINERIVRETKERVLTPYLEHDDYWWQGFTPGERINNWNPWCNGPVLAGFLLIEEDPEVRSAGIAKVMRSLDAFIATYPADGCCDEGPSYWSAAAGGLYECLEMLSLASQGRFDIFGEQIVKDIGAYIPKVHIHGDYYVAFADCDAKANPSGGCVYRYGVSAGDESLVRLGASLPPSRDPSTRIWFNLYAYARDLFAEKERLAQEGKAPYMRDAWFGVTQVMTAREQEGTEQGLYVAAKGGNNGEAHNHNDVGSFLVFADGYPLLVDLGTEEYKAQTFSARRYELWYLQSQYHNLPTVRGVLQRDGGQYKARYAEYSQQGGRSELRMDIAGAYPEEAGIAAWERTVRLDRDGVPSVTVGDVFSMKDGAPAEMFHSLVTPCDPIIGGEGSGEILLTYAPGKQAVIRYDAEQLRARIEKIDHMESRLRRNWGDRMYRIVLEERQPVAAGERTIAVTLNRG
ncbi:heparinase II/III domain-containing protein [Paenibacillus silvisoli]|uniref:heparinase II/III domain-containing protein n=1 Tax=Paenibacillus silvisoli TaxID=3110539 RepID=UPI002805ADFF|nr:heparinase II/III family protein [Paenibacillus silvisoli]